MDPRPPPWADDLGRTSLSLARAFARGATLWCVSPARPEHARHVAVEFVHPVVMGTRALPAVAVTGPDPVAQLRADARPGDVVVLIGTRDDPVLADVARCVPASGSECVRIDVEADAVSTAADVVVRYHLLWELTHVCFEHPGLLQDERPVRAGAAAAAAAGRTATAEGTDFLYPFLEAGERDSAGLLADLAASAEAKLAESRRVAQAVVAANRATIDESSAAMAARFAAGARLFTFGNGGSSTDAASVAALYARPPSGRSLPARCLAEDAAVLTALANDVGFDLVFSRQLIAHGEPGDIALGLSTSGSSRNLMVAFAEARRCGMLAVGVAGYDGGEMARGGLDHCLVVASDSVHRIQEAQAALTHELWQTVQRHLGESWPDG